MLDFSQNLMHRLGTYPQLLKTTASSSKFEKTKQQLKNVDLDYPLSKAQGTSQHSGEKLKT